MVEKSAEKYGDWLDKSINQASDYLKIVGTMKKEETFHAMKLFCKEYHVDDVFNPQVVFATSGTGLTILVFTVYLEERCLCLVKNDTRRVASW